MPIFHDPINKRIDFLDERFYTKDDKTFYPSVTTVLDLYPKGQGFNEWLKQVGFNASEIARRAAEQGSNVHDAIERFYNGKEVLWSSDSISYTEVEWKMILRFYEFHSNFVTSIDAIENSIIDEKLGVGGTIDLVATLKDGNRWLIDFKSGNAIHKTAYMQTSCYKEMWNNENSSIKVDKVGVLHLKTKHKGGSDKSIQGEGWKLYEVENTEKYFRLYQHTRAIWDEENPNPKPKNLTTTDRIKL